MSARLRVLTGAQEGREVDVTGTATLGRLATCTLPIQSNAISREHAKVYEREGNWFVVDLNSSNGTKVNGKKVTRQQLAFGDELEIGDVKIRFLPGEGGGAESAAAAGSLFEQIGAEEEPEVHLREPESIEPGRIEPGRIEPGRIEPGRIEPEISIPDVPDLEVRARPPREAPITATSGAGSRPAAGRETFAVKDRTLQFSKVANKKGLLSEDLAQRGLLFKVVAVVVVLAFCAIVFYVAMHFVASGGRAPVEETGGEGGSSGEGK